MNDANTLTALPNADPFSPEALRLTHNAADIIGVEKQLVIVPVRKPSRESWFRVHPDESYQLTTAVLELKDERETYLVAPALREFLIGEPAFVPRAIHTVVDSRGVVFLWPVRLPGPDGKLDAWGLSALEAVELAKTTWVRMTANMAAGSYDVRTSKMTLEPQWPRQSFEELLPIAFKDKKIETPDHPVLRALRGEA